jgi:hypothetical protein
LEELLSKDNEIILPVDGPFQAAEPQRFSVDQMLRCEECLRANPPTRVSCLYCAAALPHTESTARLRRPTLRPPDKHEPGYNIIWSGDNHTLPHDQSLAEAGKLLKLNLDIIQRTVVAGVPLPLARTASGDEALLILERLQDLGLQTMCLSDPDLGLRDGCITRVRSLQFEANGLLVSAHGGKEIDEVSWSDIILLVSGRLVEKKVEVQERVTRKSENELLDTSQFFADESVFDIYVSSPERAWRVCANSFDFSCLDHRKTLIAGENLTRLRDLIASNSANLQLDDSYNSLRPLLEPVWILDQETQSRGWRRERPGKYSLGAATINNNEKQFTLYSRLRYYFKLHPLA